MTTALMTNPTWMENGTTATAADDWIARFREGDAEAFEELYRRHSGAVFALSWRLTADRGLAEEMTQEVFFRAWQHRQSIKTADHLRGWLRRVAVNLRRSALRTLYRRGPSVSLDANEQEPASPSEAPPGLRSELERAVASLPKGAREVLVLHDIYGYRHTEIAEMLDLAAGTCRAHLHRARRKLQKVLT